MKQLSARSQRQLESARKDCLAFIKDDKYGFEYGLIQALAADAYDKGYRYQIVGYARLYAMLKKKESTVEELATLWQERANLYLCLGLEV